MGRPKSFINHKGPSPVSEAFFQGGGVYPNIPALKINAGTVGMGTGGLVLPSLQRSTFRGLLEAGLSFRSSHLNHGAPMRIPSFETGYPHRNTFWLTPTDSRSPEYVNILLEDDVFRGDPINLQIYANYNPSVRIPDYETHVFAEHAEDLSEIRTRVDRLGGFDSARYISRNRNQPRTVRLA